MITIYFHLLQYNTRHTISYHMSYNAIPYTYDVVLYDFIDYRIVNEDDMSYDTMF